MLTLSSFRLLVSYFNLLGPIRSASEVVNVINLSQFFKDQCGQANLRAFSSVRHVSSLLPI